MTTDSDKRRDRGGYSHDLLHPVKDFTASEKLEWLCMMLNFQLDAMSTAEPAGPALTENND